PRKMVISILAEPKISCAQISSLSLFAVRVKNPLSLLRIVKVGTSHGERTHPDFSHVPVRDPHSRLGFGDHDVCAVASAAVQLGQAAIRTPTLNHTTPTAGEQGRLGHAIAGIQRITAETVLCKRFAEAPQNVCRDSFRPTVGLTPAAKIQISPLLRADPMAAEVIRKRRTSTDGGPIAGDRREPTHRPCHKLQGCQKIIVYPAEQRLENVAYQAHVVVEGQP